jgi:hypothetical protein
LPLKLKLMPNKHNADRRHHIPKQRFGITNWATYEAGLKQRGSLTLWITPAALAGWKAERRTTRGAQARYSGLAIETFLMLRTAFGLALRQTEGLMESVLELMGVALDVPDHTTISRRSRGLPRMKRERDPDRPGNGQPRHILIDSTGLKLFGAGQWLTEKHGAKSRRGWLKLHIAMDADGFSIEAHTLTDQNVDDPSQVGLLLDQIEGPIRQVTADGAYDGTPTYERIAAHDSQIVVAIPPRATAVASGAAPPTQRDGHLETIQTEGRLAWQAAVGYGQRALVETMMNVYKTLIGPRLRSRHPQAQQTEVAIGVAVVNRMLAAARPKSVRCKVAAA